jgi:predicted acylesterase/phospholipase RssA
MRLRLLSRHGKYLAVVAICCAGMAVIDGCSAPARLDPVPSAIARDVPFLNIENARFFGDNDAGLKEGLRKALTIPQRHSTTSALPRLLAISGGGVEGAFGAGLLVGWSEHGDRPQFNVVTGTSAGALVAPFVFLGREFDWALEKMYTSVTEEEIATKRFIVAALGTDALMDSAPLYRTITKYLDAHILQRIAEEYRGGRLLLISTANLDVGKLVIWNIGAIAASDNPQRLEIVQKIILASTAVPGVFPPVMIDIMVGKAKHEEMHVDGGTISQVFLYPSALELNKFTTVPKNSVVAAAYIIRNGRVTMPPGKIERQLPAIAERAITTMLTSNGVGDLYRIYATTQRDHIAYNLAYIGEEFREFADGPFDRVYMTKLFDYGRARGRQGYAWQQQPPDFSH